MPIDIKIDIRKIFDKKSDHLLPMATFFSGLLVGVAVGLAQLDHLEKIQQEGHLKYEHDHLDFA